MQSSHFFCSVICEQLKWYETPTTEKALQKRSVLFFLGASFFFLDVPFTFDQQCLIVWIYQRHSDWNSSVSLCLPAIKGAGSRRKHSFQGVVTTFEAGRVPARAKLTDLLLQMLYNSEELSLFMK